VFTAWYGLSPYIPQIRFVCKRLIQHLVSDAVVMQCDLLRISKILLETCTCSHIVLVQHLVSSLSVSDSDDTRCCINTI
jgi:hypothetical protein